MLLLRWPWNITVCALLFVAIFVALGFWQIDRGDEKMQYAQLLESRASLPALRDRWLVDPDKQYDLRKIAIDKGVSWQKKQLLLDNVVYKGQAGVYVLQLANDDGKNFLVNRGWLHRPNRDYQLAVSLLKTDSLAGQLRLWPGSPLKLAEQSLEGDINLVIGLDRSTIENWLGVELSDFIVYLDASHPNALNVDFPEVSGISHIRHYGYAVQWFGLAFVVVVMVIVVWASRMRRSKSSVRLTATDTKGTEEN